MSLETLRVSLGRLSALSIALFALALPTIFVSSLGLAQETTGSIEGTVTDPSGAAVPHASVEISGSTLVRPRTATTDSSGYYNFSQLPPGSYEVNVKAPGFSGHKQAG